MAIASEVRGVATGIALVTITLLVAISVPFGIPGQQILETLRFHIALLALAVPFMLVVLGARLRATLMLAVVLASLSQSGWLVLEQLQRRAPYEMLPIRASLSVLSFNVLASNSNGRSIAEYMVRSRPDIAIVMETPGIERYIPDLAGTFPTRVGCRDTKNCDISLFSRLPISDAEIYNFGPFKRERLITAKVIISGHSVTVVALHMSKPYFDDFSFLELAEVRSRLRRISGPLILAGDFNAASWSYAVAQFSQQAKLIPPPVLPATWPVELDGFGLPIDNMFTRGGALIRSISAVSDPMGSNHRGLLAQVDIVEWAPSN